MIVNKNSFIQQTAEDYDMPYSEVERIYRLWRERGLFYQKLEEYLHERKFN